MSVGTIAPATAAQLRSTAKMIGNLVATGGLSVSAEMKQDHIDRLNALADVLDKITPLSVHLLNRYLEMACTCGVVTQDDNRDWDAAVKRVPGMIEALSSLAPPA
jgi:hypothetical protein